MRVHSYFCIAIVFLLSFCFSAQEQAPANVDAGKTSEVGTGEPVYKVGGSVTAPRVIHHLDPSTQNKLAKRNSKELAYSG
ncbi:MAG: hypothetical protein WBS24_01310 [Terriglobales bacterium]